MCNCPISKAQRVKINGGTSCSQSGYFLLHCVHIVNYTINISFRETSKPRSCANHIPHNTSDIFLFGEARICHFLPLLAIDKAADMLVWCSLSTETVVKRSQCTHHEKQHGKAHLSLEPPGFPALSTCIARYPGRWNSPRSFKRRQESVDAARRGRHSITQV